MLGLELIARARLRNRRLRADVFESSPVGGCKYERYVRYISTDGQLYIKNLEVLYILIFKTCYLLKNP